MNRQKGAKKKLNKTCDEDETDRFLSESISELIKKRGRNLQKHLQKDKSQNSYISVEEGSALAARSKEQGGLLLSNKMTRTAESPCAASPINNKLEFSAEHLLELVSESDLLEIKNSLLKPM